MIPQSFPPALFQPPADVLLFQAGLAGLLNHAVVELVNRNVLSPAFVDALVAHGSLTFSAREDGAAIVSKSSLFTCTTRLIVEDKVGDGVPVGRIVLASTETVVRSPRGGIRPVRLHKSDSEDDTCRALDALLVGLMPSIA
jgi:hypothetical protein